MFALLKGSRSKFRAKVHGHSAEILSAERDSGPRRIVIVLDASGSMGDFWRLETAAAEGLLGADQESSFALITFTNHVEKKIDFAQGRQRMSDGLKELEAPIKEGLQGRTALRDALLAALDLLRPAQFGDAIVLVSDGGDNASPVKDSRLTNALILSQVRLFALIKAAGVSSRGRTPEQDGGPQWVRTLVADTGGDPRVEIGDLASSTFRATSRAPLRLPPGADQVILFATKGFDEEITDFCRLTLKLPEPLDKPRDLQLEVVDANGKRNSHWSAVYPQRLAACP